MQVLKEEVRNRILEAAEEVFFEKDYRSAKLAEIAELADVPVSLIYTYFKSKEQVFDMVVGSVYMDFSAAFKEEEQLSHGSASERFSEIGRCYIEDLICQRKKLVILMDRSAGTKHEKAKDELIRQMQEHIEKSLGRQKKTVYDPLLSHILASYFTEGLLEIARHYEDVESARNMLTLMAQCYFTGVDSL